MLFPTTNILYRVFHVRSPIGNTGTAFAIDVDGREYLLTAGHVADELDGEDIQINRNGQWWPYETRVIGRGEGIVDVSVLALPVPLVSDNERYPLPASTKGLVLGQETMFLGFPGVHDVLVAKGESLGFQHQNGFPLPLVKYARVSALPLSGYPMWLDGTLNEGFSGSPLCFSEPSKPQEVIVAGVVVAAPVGMETGFVLAWDVSRCIELIHRKPRGPKI